MKAHLERGGAVHLGVEQMVRGIVAELAMRTQQIAAESGERVQDLSMQLGELSHKVLTLTTALADSQAEAEQLRAELDAERSRMDFAMTGTDGNC